MNDDMIVTKVNAALAEEFELDIDELHAEAHIRDDLGLDSLDIVDMVIVLEKTFQFKLPNREALATIQTLGDIYAYIAQLRDTGVVPSAS